MQRAFASRRVGAVVLTLLLVVTVRFDWWFRDYWLDDPFISFRYARNLVHGHGLVYNPGERVEGFSNPSWTFLSALAIALHIDPLVAARALGAALHVGTVALLWHGIRRLRPGGTLLPATLACAALATSSWTALWAVAGLETPLVGFLLLGTAVAVQRDRQRVAAALLTVLALTRFEGVVFGVLFAVLLIRRRGLTREVGRQLALLFGPFVAFLLVRVAYYGHVLPNSYTDKTGLPLLESSRRGIAYLVRSVGFALRLGAGPQRIPTGLVVAVLLLFVLCAAASLHLLRRVQTDAQAAGWWAANSVVVVLAVTVVGGGDWMPAARFLVPALPLVALLIGWGLVTLAGRVPPPAGRLPQPAVLGATTLLVLALVQVGHGQHENAVASVYRYQPASEPAVDRNPAYREVARWLRGHTDPGDLVAIEEAGLIPYETPELRYLDLFGLTDEHIARSPGTPPLDKHDNAYVLAARPRYMVIWGTPGRRGGFLWSRQQTLVNDPRFRSGYRRALQVKKDARFQFVVFERRDQRPSS